jgi:hypothetical protein
MTIQTYSPTTVIGNAYASSGNTAVTFMSFCNYSGADVTANVYIVPAGNSASTTNVVLSSLPLTPSDTYQLYLGAEKVLLANGDTIQVNVSANAAVTVVTSYTSI